MMIIQNSVWLQIELTKHYGKKTIHDVHWTWRWSLTGHGFIHSSHRQFIRSFVALYADMTFHFLPNHFDPVHRFDQLQKIVSVLNQLIFRQTPAVLLPVEYPVFGWFDEEVAKEKEIKLDKKIVYRGEIIAGNAYLSEQTVIDS